MDPNAASAPGLISSLEAMIQASVTSLLDRQLGPAANTLDAQIQAAVAAALDNRLGPAVGSLGNRMTSFVEQRLRDAVSTLNHRVNTSVAAALEHRLGPAGSALTAQIIFTTAPASISPSVPAAKAQILSEINVMKGNIGVCPADELANAPPTGKGGSNEKDHLSQVNRAKYTFDTSRIWGTKYEYIILPVGRWVASNYMQDPAVSNSSKRTIEQWATEFGTNVFLGKLWVEDPQARIESDRVVMF